MNQRAVWLSLGFSFLLGWGLPLSAELRVVATTQMIGELVDQLAGDAVEVTVLMGPGVDPHLYKASARDVRALRQADVIFYNGHHLEGQMIQLFQNMNRQEEVTFALAEALPNNRLIDAEDYADAFDPHVWFDPSLWKLVVSEASRVLQEKLPEAADAIHAQEDAIRSELTELYQWAQAELSQVPADIRTVITSHDAYSYFGEAFGFEVVGVQGLSTATEAGLADITRISDLITDRGIPAIFVEASLSTATIEAVVRQTGVRVGGELFSDSLGATGEMREIGGETYAVGTLVGAFRYNVRVITTGLLAEVEAQ